MRFSAVLVLTRLQKSPEFPRNDVQPKILRPYQPRGFINEYNSYSLGPNGLTARQLHALYWINPPRSTGASCPNKVAAKPHTPRPHNSFGRLED
jgi:hypothetical protein